VDLENGIEPPAVDASSQRVRSAAVILDKSVDVKD
jgi:hypothetical protein